MTAKPAVVLLSGGLDSTTVLAIARVRGLRALRAELPLRATAQRRAGGGRPGRAGARRGPPCRRRHRPAGLRRIGADRRHRGAESRPARRTRATTSRSPTCRRATRSSCRSRWPGPRRSARATSSSGSTPWTTAATPTAGRSTSRAYEQMANLATKAGVEGRQRLKIHTPLIDMTKAQIIERGSSSGVDYATDAQLLRPRPDGPRVRHVRLLPAASPGLRRARPGRSGAGAAVRVAA